MDEVKLFSRNFNVENDHVLSSTLLIGFDFEVEPVLVSGIKKVEGVVSVALKNKYDVVVSVGSMFDRESVGSRLTRLIDNYIEFTRSEPVSEESINYLIEYGRRDNAFYGSNISIDGVSLGVIAHRLRLCRQRFENIKGIDVKDYGDPEEFKSYFAKVRKCLPGEYFEFAPFQSRGDNDE